MREVDDIPSFKWRLQARGTRLNGQHKARMVETIEELCQRIAGEHVAVSFEFEPLAVIATVSALPSDAMRQRARKRASALRGLGWQGLAARAMLWRRGLGSSQLSELERLMVRKLLREELVAATAELMCDFEQAAALSKTRPSISLDV